MSTPSLPPRKSLIPSLEVVAAVAGILSLLVALGQWFFPSPTFTGYFRFLNIQNFLLFSVATLTLFSLSISLKMTKNPNRFSVLVINTLYIIIVVYALIVGFIVNNKNRVFFELNQSNLSKLYSNNGAKIETNPNSLAIINGGWWQPIWIDQDIPENYRLTVVIKTDDASNFNIGIGDGYRTEPSFLLVMSENETYFVKQDKNIWDRATSTLTTTIDTIRSSSRYSIVIERNNNVMRALLNGSKLFDNVRIPPELRNLNHFYIAANRNNGNQNAAGSVLIESFVIEDIN